jgi:NAD+ kinase
MALSFKTIALIGRYKSRDVGVPLARLGRFLRKLGCRVLVDRQTSDSSGVRTFPVADFKEIGRIADLGVVLGGDGSMLSAARMLAPHRTPLVGINQGRLGFTTDIAMVSMEQSMRAILDGDFQAESRSMLEVRVQRGTIVIARSAGLNDAVVSKGATGRLIELIINIDGKFVYDLRSDGLIMSTPTGSTAYALSSNGPIVHPGVSGFALVPICPHTLSNRPIAIPDRSKVEVVVMHAPEAKLHVDGQAQANLMAGDRVMVRRSRHVARFIHPSSYDYFSMLRNKLHWSEAVL